MSENPPSLPVRGMTDVELNGILFVSFPVERQDWPWERTRPELERLIRHNGEREISPATVYTAFSAERRRQLDNLPGNELERRALEAWKARAERRRAAGLKADIPAPRFVENGCPESDPLATRWNGRLRCEQYLHPDAAKREPAAIRGEPSQDKPQDPDWSF